MRGRVRAHAREKRDPVRASKPDRRLLLALLDSLEGRLEEDDRGDEELEQLRRLAEATDLERLRSEVARHA